LNGVHLGFKRNVQPNTQDDSTDSDQMPPSPNSTGPLKSSKLCAFLATTNASRCREFYGGKLGFCVLEEDPLALVFDFEGTMIRVQKVPRHDPLPFTILGWSVVDIGATVNNLCAAGIVFERFAGLDQDETGIARFPRGSRVAWFKDPDGNILSIAQLVTSVPML